MTIPRLRRPVLLPLLCAAAACAKGGDTVSPQSEVQVAASHYLWVMSSLQQPAFPVTSASTIPLWGTFLLDQSSQYQVALATTNAKDSYTLSKSGVLGILIDQGPSAPRIQYSGAYGLEGDTGLFYFVDRFATTSAPSIALFWGTRIVVQAPVDVSGDWHLFSQHLILTSSSVPAPSNIGRAVAGAIAIDAAGAVTGQGVESTLATILFSGTATTFPDSRVDLNLAYADPLTTKARAFRCGIGTNVMLGLDPNTAQGEAGLIALVRKRTGTADPALLAGEYHIGIHSIFVNPSRPGLDAATGTLTFNATGAFTLEATGAPTPGQPPVTFTYSGTYVLQDDGKLTLTVPATAETWFGAVDQDYKTVVIDDVFVEQRIGTKPPELNLCLALREAPTP